VLVIGVWADTIDRVGIRRQRVLAVINGRSWPNTERLTYAIGDTVRWRVINASADLHPMHLHGFYFRIASRGDGVRDTIYAPREDGSTGDLAVTEGMISGATLSLVWVPERAGNWLFHCHVPEHIAARGPLGTAPSAAHPSLHPAETDHARGGMNGLALGVTVRPTTRNVAARVPPVRARHLRLLVWPNAGSTDDTPFFSYALDEGGAEPAVDTGLVAAPTLDLARGEPVRITVVNRLGEPTAVHWHGIELESYYDGVAGFSGAGRQATPLIAPNDSFEVRFTPPRAGTFIYHTHVDELRQQFGGLIGALVVLEPGETWDAERDLVVLLSDAGPRRMYINGSLDPAPKELEAGKTYRLRIADIALFRMALRIRLLRDSALVSWRPVAKDGFALPAAQTTVGPSIVNLPSGETADFEFTPDRPGDLVLEVVGASNQPPQGRLRLHVSPARRPADSTSRRTGDTATQVPRPSQ
jgi:manganese oxidase